MNIQYDEDTDALYLALGNRRPNRVVEVMAGVNMDVTEDGWLVGIEILSASGKVDLDNILPDTPKGNFGNSPKNIVEEKTQSNWWRLPKRMLSEDDGYYPVAW